MMSLLLIDTRASVNNPRSNNLDSWPLPVRFTTALATDCDCPVSTGPADRMALRYPVIYALELTPTCNNRCPGCSNSFIEEKKTRRMVRPHQAMDLTQWETILDLIAPHVQHLRLTGGEATLHPQFAKIVQAVQQRDLRFAVFTNGRWRDPNGLIEILAATPHCTSLLISLHGATAEAHEAFTGIPGSFAETIANIQRAAQAGLVVHTNTVLTRPNHTQLGAIVALSHALGSGCAIFNRYVGPSVPELALPLHELRHALYEVEQIGSTGLPTKLGTCIPTCFANTSAAGCLAGLAFCTVDPWGNVRPCTHASQSAGNLFTASLEQLWHSATLQTWRQMIPEHCRDCSVLSLCNAGCRADAALSPTPQHALMVIPTHVSVP